MFDNTQYKYNDMHTTGTVKWFNDAKGLVFITPPFGAQLTVFRLSTSKPAKDRPCWRILGVGAVVSLSR